MHEWGELVMAGKFLGHHRTDKMLFDRDDPLFLAHGVPDPAHYLTLVERPLPGSVRLDAGELHHLAPLLGLLSDDPPEFGRRAWENRAGQFGNPCLHLGIGKAGIDVPVELA